MCKWISDKALERAEIAERARKLGEEAPLIWQNLCSEIGRCVKAYLEISPNQHTECRGCNGNGSDLISVALNTKVLGPPGHQLGPQVGKVDLRLDRNAWSIAAVYAASVIHADVLKVKLNSEGKAVISVISDSVKKEYSIEDAARHFLEPLYFPDLRDLK